MGFIRLFFPCAAEERVAVRWAQSLASLIGDQVGALRPETTLREIFEWIEKAGENAKHDGIWFAVAVAEELYGNALPKNFENFENMTFREFAESAC